jgi:hypothetical protein
MQQELLAMAISLLDKEDLDLQEVEALKSQARKVSRMLASGDND